MSSTILRKIRDSMKMICWIILSQMIIVMGRKSTRKRLLSGAFTLNLILVRVISPDIAGVTFLYTPQIGVYVILNDILDYYF